MLAFWDDPVQRLRLGDVFNDVKPRQFVEGLLLLVVFLLLARAVRMLSTRLLGGGRVDVQVSLLVTRMMYLATVLLGLLGFFSLWLGNLTLVVGGFGIFALAFSLAFQDILKNFLAGIFLLLERPFRIGDEITVEGYTGSVEMVQIRTTTLRTEAGEEVQIPNSRVYTQTVVNRSRYPLRLYSLAAKVPAGVPLDGLTSEVETRLRGRPDIAREPPVRVGLLPSIDGGVMLEARYWLDYRRHDPRAVQAALGEEIYRAIDQAPAPARPTPDAR